ncbi:MAG TPA: Arm DNA-binding domain-containing protein, partial [Candidatus Kurthia intestinigallinarum]|nr:Arm DNA-binding domain-containing protein [Candidatus Kurthia intestinigallinarum]
MGKPNLTKTKEKYVFSYTTDKNKQKKYAYRYRYTRRDNMRKEYYKQGFSTAKEAALALTELKADL